MRIEGLDIARFLAFFGMVLVNFRIAAEVSPTDDFASLLTNLLEGRAAALFVVLAGVGVSLASLSRSVLTRRALFLFAVGMVNVTIFDADILHFYALYFLCALPVLFWEKPALIALAAAVICTSFLALLLFNFDAGWIWKSYSYSDFWTLPGFLRHSFYNGWHPVFPWVAFLFIGMAIGQLPLSEPRCQRRLLGIGILLTLLGVSPSLLNTDPELAVLLGTAPIPATPFYMISATGSALVILTLCLWAGTRLSQTRIGLAMALAGRQSLTLYLVHILLGMGLLDELGLLNGSLSTVQIFLYSLGFTLMCLIYAFLWQKIARRGPLETLMRKTAG